jgi:hypothetical protein
MLPPGRDINVRVFPALLQDKREVLTATSRQAPAPLCRSIMQLREQPNGSCLFCGEHATKQANHRLPK